MAKVGRGADHPSKNKILLLGATFQTDNMGVGALTAGAIAAIDNYDSQCVCCILDYGRDPVSSSVEVHGREIVVPLINLRFSWKLFLPNNVASLLAVAIALRMLPGSLRRRAISRNRWLCEISEARVAVAVSGGDSFSDVPPCAACCLLAGDARPRHRLAAGCDQCWPSASLRPASG